MLDPVDEGSGETPWEGDLWKVNEDDMDEDLPPYIPSRVHLPHFEPKVSRPQETQRAPIESQTLGKFGSPHTASPETRDSEHSEQESTGPTVTEEIDDFPHMTSPQHSLFLPESPTSCVLAGSISGFLFVGRPLDRA